MKTSNFDNFEIEHLSPSSIGLFISNPAKWCFKYLYKEKDTAGPSAWRGSVVDSACGKFFGLHENQKTSVSLAKCQVEAIENMNQLLDLEKANGNIVDEDKFRKEIELVPDYIRTAIGFYDELQKDKYVKPIDYQKKVIYEDEDLPIPIEGWLDFEYEDCIRDIKTVSRTPSDMSSRIKRQLSLYAYTTNKKAYADFIICTRTKNDVVSYELSQSEANRSLNELKKGAFAIEKFISISKDVDELASFFIPDFDDWIWSDEEKDKAKKLWRL